MASDIFTLRLADSAPLTMMSNEVTVVVLTYNEESRLEPTLVAALASGFPVLVVDAMSTDRTREISVAAGCTVLAHPQESFSDQRNWAMQQVETRYVLFVDADEVLTPDLASEVRAAAKRDVAAAWIPTLDYFAGRWMLHGGWYPQPHLRLLRRGAAHFERPVHERVVVDEPGEVPVLAYPLVHLSHLTLANYIEKLNRYTSADAMLVTGTPRRLIARGVFEAVAVMVRRLVVQRGWRDGTHGLVGAASYAYYRFAIYAKAATNAARDEPTVDAAMKAWRRQRRA